MIKNAVIFVLSCCAMAVIIFLVRLRDAVCETMAIAKYLELLKSSAITENPAAIKSVTGVANDWTAVPHYLCATQDHMDSGVLVMLLPIALIAMISGYGLVAEFSKRGN